MKSIFLFCLSLIFSVVVTAQNFTGQWTGHFVDKSTSFRGFGGDECDYVIDLECKDNMVSGYSYTYFSDGGKKYYTICRLEGKVIPKQQYIEIKEVERTKTNVPVNIRNCFQVHKLTFFKHADSATLEGNWVPAPDQNGDCGYGTTVLSKRMLKNNLPGYNSATTKGSIKQSLASAKKENGKTGNTSTTIKTAPSKPVAKIPPPQKKPIVKTPVKQPAKKPVAAAPVISEIAKNGTPAEVSIQNIAIEKTPDSVTTPKVKFEKRSNTVLETISVKNKTVKVDLYDNGEIDGDSISLFYNGKLLMSSKRLSEKPISLTITVEDNVENELVMYAENLGTIPPNTALMVVTDGNKRYEVRITSDLQKSGVINFVHKP